MKAPRSTAFELPPTLITQQGQPRRVGFELEFSGIDLEETITAVKSALPATEVSRTEAEVELDVPGLGHFNIEIDWAYLKSKAAQTYNNSFDREWVELLTQVAALLVPVEVVCPPIDMARLHELSPMVDALKTAGAVGTEESFISAYGVHINTEIPSLDAECLAAYIKAYCLLQWWLIDTLDINMARRISPYIDLYPEAYIKRVLAQANPTMDQLFTDYLEYNPSRNRALDLLPLLAEIDEERVRRRVKDTRVNARPAFHFRLPDCHIEQEDWSLQTSWQSWLVIEKLANHPDALETLSQEFLKRDRPVFNVSRSEWVDTMDQWLKNHALV